MNLRADWPYLQEVAAERLENNRTSRHVSEYGEYLEVLGAAGELAVRRFLNLNTVLHVKFDGGYDLVYRGKKFDVKATKLVANTDKKHLQWPIWKPIGSDYVIMAAVDMERKTAVILGYASAKDVLKAEVNEDRKYPCHEIPIPQLRQPWRLLARKNP